MERPTIIYDGSETLSVTRVQIMVLQDLGLVIYSPEDGPFGIVYRPKEGHSIEDIKNALSRLFDHSDSS